MADENRKSCGIVRPIAPLEGLPAEHWAEVHNIIVEALGDAFETRLVSDAEDAGVIQGRIVKNLFEADLVICDVSGRNANVMFELGMRLAFDKPTIVIKDDATAYSFDSSPIEHLPYPRTLRFSQMVTFKEDLLRKALATIQAPTQPGYRSFLQHFGPIQVASFEHEEVPAQAFLLNQLSELRSDIARLANSINHRAFSDDLSRATRTARIELKLDDVSTAGQSFLLKELSNMKGVKDVNINVLADHTTATITVDAGLKGNTIASSVQKLYEHAMNLI